MSAPTAADPVADQYERWVYPQPSFDLGTYPFHASDCHYDDLRILAPTYWPTQPAFAPDLDILVAGCGSMAAACYAYRYPQARVMGIDLSAASLAHEEYLKNKHGLGNLTLQQCRIEDATGSYDFVASAGVLHHMADPVRGLHRLGEVIKPHGVIAIMVYAKYGRLGVYMMQDLFKILGLEQTPADVETVKFGLNALGPHHPVRNYLRLANDLDSDTGLVDTFLHRQDRSYSVGECMQLVGESGLAFLGWDENVFYHPDFQLPAQHPFRAHLERLTGPPLWQAMELLHGSISGHFFSVCRRDRKEADYRVPFEDATFTDAVPIARIDGLNSSAASSIGRAPFPSVPLDAGQRLLFGKIDGTRSVRECIVAAGMNPALPAVIDFARNFLRGLWRVGYVQFRWK